MARRRRTLVVKGRGSVTNIHKGRGRRRGRRKGGRRRKR